MGHSYIPDEDMPKQVLLMSFFAGKSTTSCLKGLAKFGIREPSKGGGILLKVPDKLACYCDRKGGIGLNPR